MRARSVSVFLLLGAPNVLAQPGSQPLSASNPISTATWFHLLAFLDAYHWLSPGLILAILLLILLALWNRSPEPPQRPIRRIFRAPNLTRFCGIVPRHHRDLEA